MTGPIYCATCRRALNRVSLVGRPVTWMHTRTDDGHLPKPISVFELPNPIYRCDFCSVEGEEMLTYIFEALDTEYRKVIEETISRSDYVRQHNAARARSTKTHTALRQRDSEAWCACISCGVFIDARDAGGLITRVMEHGPKEWRSGGSKQRKIRGVLYGVYEPLFKTFKEKMTAIEYLECGRKAQSG